MGGGITDRLLDLFSNCPLTAATERGCNTDWKVAIICGKRNKRGERELSCRGLFFHSLWCYSRLFRGEGLLNVSPCVNGCSCLFHPLSFTPVITISSFELSTSACVYKSKHILMCGDAPIQKVGQEMMYIKCRTSELYIYMCWQMLSMPSEDVMLMI